MTRGPLVALVGCVVGVGLVSSTVSCGRPCRAIAVQPVELRCQDTSTFTGEIHFDDRATFASFLESDDCLPLSEADEVTAILDSVDFLEDAVFVASDVRALSGRCIAKRDAEVVEVCNDGLRLSFGDDVTDDTECPGKWTVSFALPRAEMRAATIDEL